MWVFQLAHESMCPRENEKKAEDHIHHVPGIFSLAGFGFERNRPSRFDHHVRKKNP